MGATVTGIDAVDKNIKIAHIHAVCITHVHAKYYLDLDKKCMLLSLFIGLVPTPMEHIMLVNTVSFIRCLII
jgi:ribonuclease BN (tRNA processing enzyme)